MFSSSGPSRLLAGFGESNRNRLLATLGLAAFAALLLTAFLLVDRLLHFVLGFLPVLRHGFALSVLGVSNRAISY